MIQEQVHMLRDQRLELAFISAGRPSASSGRSSDIFEIHKIPKIKSGERIRVDTRIGQYVERVK